MVAGLFLVERTTQGDNDDRNKVRAAVVNDDDGNTDAQIIQTVVDGLNAAQPAGGEKQYPDGYFDTVTQIGASPQGVLATDNDFLAFPREVASERT